MHVSSEAARMSQRMRQAGKVRRIFMYRKLVPAALPLAQVA